MAHSPPRYHSSLSKRFPPSEPCTCTTCTAFCQRPGWWSVAEAARALEQQLGPRMMLEVAPDRSFGVLAPAFYGSEASFAFQKFASRGCNFLVNQRCQLFGSGLQPLECRFCHHARLGQGPACHAALEQNWDTLAGRRLVRRWCKQLGLWQRLPRLGLEKLMQFQG